MSQMQQPKIAFFYDPDYPETESVREYDIARGVPVRGKPSLENLVKKLSPENPSNPFNKIIGQDMAKRTMRRAAVSAMMNPYHLCTKNFLVTGPSSVGKTTIVRTFAKVLRVPIIEISPRSISTMQDVLRAIRQGIESHGKNLMLLPLGKGNQYDIPPCIIFVDEAHALRRNVQNELLKAVEAHDRSFTTEAGDHVSTANVCWCFATTEVGDLFGPLLNRFSEINLVPYTKAQVAQIVNVHYPEWDLDLCKLVAHYESRVPRRALAFAAELAQEMILQPDEDCETLAEQIAEEMGIDQYGMNKRHLQILQLAAEKPISKDRLALNLHVSKEELERLIVPPLLMQTDDNPALLTVCQGGYTLTNHGQLELTKRKLGAIAGFVMKGVE
jgi:Holliday junction resolvasome RuvABC ATP-dependent DNA helicase subunit